MTKPDALRRLEILCRIIKRLEKESTDDPIRHLHKCSCGRAETRFGKCSICESEEMREGKPTE
jgi:hypothetical protein